MKNVINSILSLSLIASQSWGAPTDLARSVDDAIAELPAVSQKAAMAPEFRNRLIAYLESLQLKNDRSLKELLSRLFQSSTQLVVCNQDDWSCLERKPMVLPSVAHRLDESEDLGKPVKIKEPLSIETYFTKKWSQRRMSQPEVGDTVAQIMGKTITKNAKDGLYMAIYGIDDIKESMKPVFDAIEAKVNAGVPTQAVVDVSKEGSPNSFARAYDVVIDDDNNVSLNKFKLSDLDFSYVKPADPKLWAWGRPQWMDQIQNLDPSVFAEKDSTSKDAAWIIKQPGGKNAIRLAFQYKDTPALVGMINRNIKSNETAQARIEYPMDGLMHNKFAVMKDGKKMSVWTGTTNVSETCMGTEKNSNMAIVINHTEVAQEFLKEFQEMYGYDASNTRLKKDIPSLITGRFHKQKRPNTKRYFQFSDGHEMRLHFSPTDDGEHRAILPMIWTAKEGDTIRISMFGSGGIEGVRALQHAAARGVKIQIVLDNVTGSGLYSWIKDSEGNFMEENPYAPGDLQVQNNIQIRLNNWPGLNHQKSATLTRANGRVETLIVGSQNWSLSGNDTNDENMVTIRHKTKSVKAGEAFNENFDRFMYPLALSIRLTADGKIEKFGGEEVDASSVEGIGDETASIPAD